ncbi:PTS sugar transporter subunit IIB [Culicoidibacter larvae]|uniref:PTS sugar transporter subunit IIB n=1 Tax=Culicoidibacter larvae TaxID=2579976 RepID=A0A5R8QFZ6_9FIRM|nr:PTS sugar transporter subunit IIB [Culicoidibacter larvae]TLG75393.1 PTS sugar transporter subunit IIB [Culicoidibacter larvae]
MKVLMACAGGMSSSFVADALKTEASNRGITDFEIIAVGDARIKEELGKNYWQIVILAPQVRFQSDRIKQLCDPLGIPVYNIENTSYTPMGAPKILDGIIEALNHA